MTFGIALFVRVSQIAAGVPWSKAHSLRAFSDVNSTGGRGGKVWLCRDETQQALDEETAVWLYLVHIG